MRMIQPRIHFIEAIPDSVTAGEAVGTLAVTILVDTDGVEKVAVTGHVGPRPAATVNFTDFTEGGGLEAELEFPAAVLPTLWDRVRVSVSVYGTRGLIVRRYVDLAVQEPA